MLDGFFDLQFNVEHEVVGNSTLSIRKGSEGVEDERREENREKKQKEDDE